MKRSWLKLVPKRKASDLAFLPPFSEQAKYLALADQFIALDKTEPREGKVVRIDSGKNFRKTKKAA